LDLGQVIALQAIDGSWGDVGQLCDLGHGRVAEFGILDGDVERSTISATISGVAILRTQCEERAPAWRMIELKALKWLAQRCPAFEKLIEEAVRQLSV
jgi:hypothetical protein